MDEEDRQEERERAKEMARKAGLPFVDLNRFAPEAKAIAAVPRSIAQRHNILPVKLDNSTRTLYVAMARVPDEAAVADVRDWCSLHVRPVLAGENAIKEYIARAYE